MNLSPDTQDLSTVPDATALGRTARPFTESTPRRLAACAVGVVAAFLLTAGTAEASGPADPIPSPAPWPTAPTCAELQAQRTPTTPSCEWYRSRAIAEAARLRACTVAAEPGPSLVTFRFVAPTAY